MVKESIIKISKPIPKVQNQQKESELESSFTLPQEIAITEELPEPEAETTDTIEPTYVKYAATYHNGWKVSDILREIRLDDYSMGSAD